MKKMWFFVVIIVIMTSSFSACEKSPARTAGNVQIDTVKKLIGEWQWIFVENVDSGELLPADNKAILKISALDSIIDDQQEFAVAFEVFVEDTLFRKEVSPIYKIYINPKAENPLVWTRRTWFYVPYIEKRSCTVQFVSHNEQPSLDTLCFDGIVYKAYYARIK